MVEKKKYFVTQEARCGSTKLYNSNFSVYKYKFIGTQPSLFICISHIAAFALQRQSGTASHMVPKG